MKSTPLLFALSLITTTGTAALLASIREIYALDYLRGLSKTEEFGKALGKSLESKVKSVGGIVRDSVGTIKNVPKGASRFFGRVGEGASRGKTRRQPLHHKRGTPARTHRARAGDGRRRTHRQRRDLAGRREPNAAEHAH